MLKGWQHALADFLHYALDTFVRQYIGFYGRDAGRGADVSEELLRRLLAADNGEDVVVEFSSGEDG
jgi:hypothetical protein